MHSDIFPGAKPYYKCRVYRRIFSTTVAVSRVNGLAAGLTGTQKWARWATLLAALLCPLAAAAQAVPGDVPAAQWLARQHRLLSVQVRPAEIPESALPGAQTAAARPYGGTEYVSRVRAAL